MRSGHTLWQEMCLKNNLGVAMVETYRNYWSTGARSYIDSERWQQVDSLLQVQLDNAREWRKVCLEYFQTFSGQPILKY